MMGAASRDKGKRGERELAEFLRGLTGSDVRRRVRQHDGDSDLEGLPGWCVECKRHATAAPADVARWWRQTAAQAHRVGAWPLLAWRADRMRDWVFVWPAGLHCTDAPPQSGHVADTLLVASGTDPLGQRAVTAVARQEPQVHRMTFQRAAEIYIETHAPSWSNAKHASQWSNSLRDHAHPIIGKLPVDAITVDHIRRILKPIWNTKNETASRVRGRIERILGWASVRGYRTGENPARWQGFLSEDFPKRSRAALPKHHAALPYAEAPAFYKHLTSVGGVSPQFLRFIMLTAVRTGEAQKVRWDEIDFEAKLWTVPALRMKAKREHRVPLSEEAIALLLSVRAAQQLTPEVVESPYVFVTTKADKPISNMAALALLKRLGRTDITPHGMRSTFRDWAAEQTDHAREVAEAALAHTLTNRVEAAYQRGDLLEKRQKLMKDWARFLTR